MESITISGIRRRDPHLPEPFDARNLEGKAAAKRLVLATYGFPDTSELRARPLVGMISRLVDQKGFDLLADLADELPRLGRDVRACSGTASDGTRISGSAWRPGTPTRSALGSDSMNRCRI